MASIHQRFDELITALGTNIYQLSKDLSHKRPDKFYSIVNGKAKPSYDTIEEVIKLYPHINVNWVFRGVGEMFLDITQEVNGAGVKNYERLIEPQGDARGETILVVDAENTFTYPWHYTEKSYLTQLPVIVLPKSQFKNSIYRCFQVIGDSMSETLFPNDIVIAFFVDDWTNLIRDRQVYVIITRDAVLVKRVVSQMEEQNKLLLVSDNDAYPTQTVNMSEVQEIWWVEAEISFNLENIRYNLFRRLSKVESDIVGLKERLSQ